MSEKYDFKKKISGYNPAEVDSYLTNLEEVHKERCFEFDSKNKMFSEKISELEKYIKELEEKQEKDKTIISCDEDRKNINVDLSELNLLKKNNKDLNVKIQMYRDKSKKYDSMINKVEEILGEGRTTAEKIIYNAHDSAKKIQEIAIRKVEQQKVQAEKVITNIRDEYKIMMEELKGCRAIFKKTFISVDDNICTLGKRIDTITLKYLENK